MASRLPFPLPNPPGRERRVPAEAHTHHLGNLPTDYDCLITNAVSEGLAREIQPVKTNARDFRDFLNYHIAILFHCGKLDLLPL